MAKKNDNTKALTRVSSELHEITKKQWVTLEEAEFAFQQAIQYEEQSLLVNCLAAWEIAEKELYKPRFRTLNAYLMESKARLGVGRSYFFERVNMGDFLRRHERALLDAGFRPDRDVSKLKVIHHAVEAHGFDAAVEMLPRLSFRDYKAWIRGNLLEDGTEPDGIDVYADSEGIRCNGDLVISRKAVTRIYQQGEEPYVVGVKNDTEKRALSRWLNERRKEGKGGE